MPENSSKPAAKELKHICAICGKPLNAAMRGSITSWLFQDDRCTCVGAKESQYLEILQQAEASVNTQGPAKAVPTVANASQTAADDFASLHLGPRYQVIGLLGAGGMGRVFKVRDLQLGVDMAAKLLHPNLITDAAAAKRFEREARTAFELKHANIVNVHDFGLLDDDTPFLIMEIANGETLGERLRRTGRLTVDEAIPIFVQVCFGLAYAHDHNVVHRDIKPNNIMLLDESGAEGSIKIVDFGIAKLIQHDGGEIQALTRTGEVFGSPLYMSPEQCAGGRVDHRSDIYSLGCVLFEALTGTPPCIGETALKTMMRHQTEPAPTLKEASLGAEFPSVLEKIVAIMLEKSPDSRYQNLGIAAHDLAAVKRGDSLSFSTGKSSQTNTEVKTKTISMAAWQFYGLLFGLVVLAAISGYLLQHRPHENARNSVIASHNFDSISSPAEKPKTVSIEKGSKFFDASAVPKDSYVMSLEELNARLKRPGNELILRGCTLPDKSFELIANSHWTRLDLRESIFTNAALSKLAQLKLEHLDLSGSDFNDIGAKALSAGKGCRDLLVNDDALSGDAINYLAKIPGLQKLHIAGDKITKNNMVQLGRSKELDELHMREVRDFQQGWLSALEQSQLGTLDLRSTPIDDDSIRHLSKMRHLAAVYLSGTGVTMSGIRQLCKERKTIKKIWCTLEQKEILLLEKEFPDVMFTKPHDPA